MQMLISIILLVLFCSPAWGRSTTVVVGQGTAAASCTSPTGDDFSEGFEGCAADLSSGCDLTWTKVGAGTAEIVATPGTPGSNTACIKSFHFSSSDAATSVKRDRGSAYDLDTGSGYDITVYANIHSVSASSSNYVTLLYLFQSDGSDGFAKIEILNDSGTYKLRAVGSSASTGTALTVDTWYKLILHLDPTGESSTFQVCDLNGANCGSAYTFTRTASRDFRWMYLGALSVDAGETFEGYVGFIHGNTP